MISDFSECSSNLELRDGIWFSRSSMSVCYPNEGNRSCFEIEDQSYWFQHRNKCILAVLHHFPPQGTVFDVGAGNGYVAAGIHNAGIPVVVMEPGVEGARNAMKRGLPSVICSTFEEADFSERSIPAIGLFDVIEHIQDDELFLKRLSDALQSGGRLYLTTPAYKFLWSFEDEYAQHHRRYTRSELTKKLNQSGFCVEFASYIFALLPLPIFLCRVLPTRLANRKEVRPEVESDAHRLPEGLTGRILASLLEGELHLIWKGIQIPFGGSCLMVARKL